MTTSQYIFIKTSLDWHGQDTDKRTSLLCGQDDFNRGRREAPNVSSVSYTHLDVYKRQSLDIPKENVFLPSEFY